MNPSPLRYPGGKYKLYKYVEALVKANGCTTYIEPFCGGTAIALELLFNNLVKKIIINDFDYTIFCFWDSVLNCTDDFIDLIQNTDVTIQEWERQKEIRNTLDQHNSLEIGFSTFFLNRTNRSGIIDKAGPIGGKDQTGNYSIDCRFNRDKLIEQVRKIASYREKIQLHNMEAMDFIDQVILKTRNSFTFFDPPYYSKGPGLYTIAIGKVLKLSPPFPPLHTGRAPFTAPGVPSNQLTTLHRGSTLYALTVHIVLTNFTYFCTSESSLIPFRLYLAVSNHC